MYIVGKWEKRLEVSEVKYPEATYLLPRWWPPSTAAAAGSPSSWMSPSQWSQDLWWAHSKHFWWLVVHATVKRAAPGVLFSSLYKAGHTFYMIWLVSMIKMPILTILLISYFDFLSLMRSQPPAASQGKALTWHIDTRYETSCEKI